MEKLIIEVEGNWKVPKECCIYTKSGHLEGILECCESYKICNDDYDGIRMSCDYCPVNKCFERLKEYEDTNLSPEEINLIKEKLPEYQNTL